MPATLAMTLHVAHPDATIRVMSTRVHLAGPACHFLTALVVVFLPAPRCVPGNTDDDGSGTGVNPDIGTTTGTASSTSTSGADNDTGWPQTSASSTHGSDSTTGGDTDSTAESETSTGSSTSSTSTTTTSTDDGLGSGVSSTGDVPDIREFDDPASDFTTMDVYDVDGDIVHFDRAADTMIVTTQGDAVFAGYPVEGLAIGPTEFFQVRFGSEAGTPRAYITETEAATICDITVTNSGRLRIYPTQVVVPMN